MTLRWLALAALAGALLVAAACAGDDEDDASPTATTPAGATSAPAGTAVDGATATERCEEPEIVSGLPAEGNQFLNGGFEEGAAPWCSLASDAWGKPFTVSSAQAQSGEHSALLELRSAEGGSARVFGVTTQVAPEEFPETVSGYYYVEEWEKGTPKQYLQFVAIVWGADNMPETGTENHQVRYILAGVDEPPIEIANAYIVMVGTGDPETGRWVRFERNLRQDFLDLWGVIPENYDWIRFLYEVRWDERQESDPPGLADVYYDDLYAGPAGGAP
jgi:hypothetical protein